MANNLYDYLNQFNLGQVVRGVPGVLQGAADTLNRYRIGLPGGPFGTRPLGQRPVVNPEFMRPDYSGAGERARRFQEYRTGRDIPGANTDYSDRLNAGSAPAVLSPGATSPAALDPYAAQNRAYQQERARVEAMVKANPDMQKQEIADARAKVRDQGMAIWAAANPELAKRLQPGQVGYDAVQQALIGNEAGQAARSGYGYQMPQQMLMTPPPGVNAPQGLPGISSFEADSTYGQQGLDVDPEMRKKFQALINAQQ